jgi:hypothetical protein
MGKLAVPQPSGLNDFLQSKLCLPTEVFAELFGTRHKDGGIAGSARPFPQSERPARCLFHSLADFRNGVSGTGPDVVSAKARFSQ